MAAHRVRLKNQRELAESTVGFYFEKPPGFTYQAGQCVNLALVDPEETDAEGNTRSFTLSSSPHEDDLMVATRMRDTAFKRGLGELRPGAEVKLAGPYGNFVLSPEPSRAAVFLAGGIGVTPFRSMALDAIHRKLSRPLFLFYSNRRPEDTAFLGELTRAGEDNSNFHLIALMTQMAKSKRVWNGPTGHLSEAELARWLNKLEGPEYYIAGPPGMVRAMQQLLKACGIPEKDIRTDEFLGYE
jgi:ferredoxin-NADP reductase